MGKPALTRDSRRQRGDGLPRFLAGPERQVARHDVDDHRPQETDGRHPEERAVVHPLPARAVRGMLGTLGTATVRLEFGIVHAGGSDTLRLRRSPIILRPDAKPQSLARRCDIRDEGLGGV